MRCFLPSFMFPRKFNYFHKLANDVELQSPVISYNDCIICMNSLGEASSINIDNLSNN